MNMKKSRMIPEFQAELKELYRDYVGRPSPVFHAKGLSKKIGGAQNISQEGRSQPYRGLTR